MDDEVVLRYVGTGDFMPGIPDRDLTAGDVAECGLSIEELMATGLYTRPSSYSDDAPAPRQRRKGS